MKIAKENEKMTVKTVLQIVTSPIELRSGKRNIFAKIKPENVRNHLKEEVTRIFSKGNKLVICSEVPDYELDKESDVPWYQ